MTPSVSVSLSDLMIIVLADVESDPAADRFTPEPVERTDWTGCNRGEPEVIPSHLPGKWMRCARAKITTVQP